MYVHACTCTPKGGSAGMPAVLPSAPTVRVGALSSYDGPVGQDYNYIPELSQTKHSHQSHPAGHNTTARMGEQHNTNTNTLATA